MANRFHDSADGVARSHADYAAYLDSCAAKWAAQGQREQANRVAAHAQRLRAITEQNCPVCQFPDTREAAELVCAELFRLHGIRWGPNVPTEAYELLGLCNRHLDADDRRRLAVGLAQGSR